MPYFQKLIVGTITEIMYQDALISLKESGISDNTLEGIHSTGNMIFDYCKKIGAIKINPAENAYVPKQVKTVADLENKEEIPRYLEKEDLATFLKCASEHGLERDYEIFRTLAYSGIRVGELCALKWRDIDFDNCTITINKTLYNPKNNYSEFKINTPKTKSSIRDIVIEQEIMDDLMNLKTIQDIEKSKNAAYANYDFVFAKTGRYAGYPEVIKVIQIRMKRLLRISCLNQDLTPHSLRHTHTSLLAEAGISLEQIMHRLGHANDDITRRIYLHITKPKKIEASQKFGELMRSLKTSDPMLTKR
ncbi:site-specific integrase [Paenibacillus sp. FJAT-26967]|uniref:tyrosine-type recombinase/integrase n=1 Tax=Paenibacillus sp. FJAT-26967 TaxID=1729690 RepID=UPI0008386FEB|nr:site-specific integrase [Paenibacillus sp. FJAT-26967]